MSALCPPPASASASASDLLGSIEAFHCPPRTTVWLRGEIDAALEPGLNALFDALPASSSEIVVDVARMTFSDLTAARFIERLCERACVTVRFPSHLTRDLLRATGLDAAVQIQARWRDVMAP